MSEPIQHTSEMTENGPVRRLGDVLFADFRSALFNRADWFLSQGFISVEQQMALDKAVQDGLASIMEAVPEEIRNMAYHPPQPMLMETSDEQGGGVGEILKDIVGKVTEFFRAFDDSPWDGSAGRWETPEAYCAACLIDMNTGGEKKKELCHLPVRAPGSKQINKNALRALASGGRGIRALKGVPQPQKAKAARFAIKHWQTAFGKAAPASLYAMAGMEAPKEAMKSEDEERRPSSVAMFKSHDQWWMLGIYSNHWRDSHSSIFSSQAHRDFADWIDRTGFRPAATLAHQPKLTPGYWQRIFEKYKDDGAALNEIVDLVYKDVAFGRVEKVIPLNGFSIALTRVLPGKESIAEALAEEPDLEMSHGCLSFKEATSFGRDGKPVTIIDKYRSFEVTTLPSRRGANAVTLPLFLEATDMGKLNEKDRALLEKLFPPELVDNLDQVTSEIESALDARLDYRSDDQEPEVPAEPAPPAEPAETAPAEAELVKAVVTEVTKALNVDGLRSVLGSIQADLNVVKGRLAEIDALKGVVTEMRKSDDERIAAQFQAPIDWGSAPTSAAPVRETLKEGEQAPVVGDPGLAEQQTQPAPAVTIEQALFDHIAGGGKKAK